MLRALDFIGDGLEYMFGTVSAKTLRQVITQMENNVDEYVSNLKNNVVSLTDALTSHQVVIDQKLSNFDKGFDLVNSALNDSFHMIQLLKNRLNKVVPKIILQSVNEHNYMQKYLLARQITVHNYALLNQIQTTKQVFALSCLMQHRLPMHIITPDILELTLEYVKSELENKFQTFSPLHSDIKIYCTLTNIQSYTTKNFLYIHLDIPITNMNTVFSVYRVLNVPIKLSGKKNESGLSKIENTSPFIAISHRGKHYFHMTEHDVLVCSKTQLTNECDQLYPIYHKDQGSCTYYIFFDITIKINSTCHVVYYPTNLVSQQIHHLGHNHYFIGYNDEEYFMENCPGSSATKIPGCSLCVSSQKPQCSIETKYFITPSFIEINKLKDTTIVHTVNIMTINHLSNFPDRKLNGKQSFLEPIELDTPKTSVTQSEIYEVAENSKKLSLDLVKAATLVKEQKQIFASSTDYLKSKLGWAMSTTPALLYSLPSISCLLSIINLILCAYYIYKLKFTGLMALPTTEAIPLALNQTTPSWLIVDKLTTEQPVLSDQKYCQSNHWLIFACVCLSFVLLAHILYMYITIILLGYFIPENNKIYMVLTNSQQCFWIPLLNIKTCPENLSLTYLNPPKSITINRCLEQYVSFRWTEFHIHDSTNDKNPLIKPPLHVYINPYQAHNLKTFLQHQYKVTFYVVHNRMSHRQNTDCGCNEKLHVLLQQSTDINQSNAPFLAHDIETQHVYDTALSHVEAKLDIDPTYATVKYKRVKPN